MERTNINSNQACILLSSFNILLLHVVNKNLQLKTLNTNIDQFKAVKRHTICKLTCLSKLPILKQVYCFKRLHNDYSNRFRLIIKKKDSKQD